MPNRSIRIYTRGWCEDSHAAKDFLKQHHIGFEEIDIEKDPQAAQFVMNANGGKQRTPTIEVDGHIFHASNFDSQKFAREFGLEPQLRKRRLAFRPFSKSEK